MKDGPLGFPVFPQEDGAFTHHLEVGPFTSDFIFPSAPGQFLRAGEELGSSREVTDKKKIVEFNFFIFQVQNDGAYPLGIDDPPNAINFCIVPLF